MSDDIRTKDFASTSEAITAAIGRSVRTRSSIRMLCRDEDEREAAETELLGLCERDYEGAFSTEFFGSVNGVEWGVRVATEETSDAT